MTPAVKELKNAGVAFDVHRFEGAPGDDGFALAAATALGVPAYRVYKTLMATDGKHFAVAIVPADKMLNLKAMAKACGWKKASMATPADAERMSGYVVGGISPLGQKRCLPRLLDDTAQGLPTVLVSGGQRGMDIELAPQSLIDCGIQWASLADG